MLTRVQTLEEDLSGLEGNGSIFSRISKIEQSIGTMYGT
eukprot:SAG31_NODE_1016_length_10365_cov_16.138418_3_plen_39_part_00